MRFAVALVLLAAAASAAKEASEPQQPSIPLTREIVIKQGKLRGIALKSSNPNRGPVDIFLGIPYAAPPVGTQRFMPPGSPPPWPGVRQADSFGPVCPQKPPDISNEKEALKAMSAGRFHYLKRLLPYLRNQSEDCLYLNIYAPSGGEICLYFISSLFGDWVYLFVGTVKSYIFVLLSLTTTNFG